MHNLGLPVQARNYQIAECACWVTRLAHVAV